MRVQCLGWYVRRSADPEGHGAFYRDTLGLPLLRQVPGCLVFWGGETIDFETMRGGRPANSAGQVASDTTPIFRVPNLDASRSRLEAAGVVFDGEETDPTGRTAFFRDSFGARTGLSERGRLLAADREAWRRWDGGETTVPGIPPMPPDIQPLGLIELCVAVLATEMAFYRDVVGLSVAGEFPDSSYLDLGDTGLLVLRSGGSVQPIPADRSEVPDMWMIRTRDFPTLLADLRDAGCHLVNEPFVADGGTLAYLLDPEHHLIGIQDHPVNPDLPDWPDDAEADRRWQGSRG